MSVRIGTRGSALALWQAQRVRDLLLQAHPQIAAELVRIDSHGDRSQGQSIADIGVIGIFTREIERALLDQRVDVAVHSLKDMPTEPPPGLVVAAVLQRDDVRDLLVARCLAGAPPMSGAAALARLPAGARIGTSSLRRRAELLRARNDFDVVPLRGNVPTRIAHVEGGELDGVVLSACGLARLGIHVAGAALIEPEIMLPAPAQGTIAVQVREDDTVTRDLVARLDDVETRLCTGAERQLLRALGGGCRVPIGALARVDGDTLHLVGRVSKPDGSRVLEASESGPRGDSERVVASVAERLLAWGARTWLSTSGQ
jgi:hydroxymethylbilane synthase